MKVSGIIVAGGSSSRMGCDKTLMAFNNETLIEHTIREISQVADEIIIASNHTAKYGIPGTIEVLDRYPGMGPLAGIHAGLLASSHPRALVAAADMPLFDAKLARYLLSLGEGYDVVVPWINGYWEPLCAVYSRRCLQPIERCLQSNIKKVSRLYANVKVLKVSEEELNAIGKAKDVFYNLNTLEEYKAFCEKTKQKHNRSDMD